MALIALAMGGDKIFPLLDMEPPEIVLESVRENKFGYVMAVWFLGNAPQQPALVHRSL